MILLLELTLFFPDVPNEANESFATYLHWLMYVLLRLRSG